MRRARATVLTCVITALAAVLSACGSSPTSPGGTPTSVSVTGSTSFSLIGQQQALTALVTRADGVATTTSTAVAWLSSNNSVVTVSSAGVATAVAVGSATITATDQGVSGTLNVRVGAIVDCNPYNPSALVLLPDTSDTVSLAMPFQGVYEFFAGFDTAADAANGLALFQRYLSECYLGRNNSRANRAAYVFTYWKDLSGQSTTIQAEDCDAYSPSALQVVNAGASGWALMDAGRQVMLLDTAADATSALAIATQYSSRCYIGRHNNRPNPMVYTLSYWR